MALTEISGTLSATTSEDDKLNAYGTVFVTGANGSGTFLSGVYSGQYGTLTLQSTGAWQYVLDNSSAAVQSLAAGAQVHELFGVTWTGSLLTVVGVINITIDGANDAAAFTGDIEKTLVVNNATAVSGQLYDQDPDLGDKGFQAATLTGTAGTLSIDKTGAWRYELAPGQQTAIIDQSKALVESFNVASSDGTVAQLRVLVTTNETVAPTVASTVPADGAANVAVDANLTVEFSEPIRRGSGTIVLKTAAGAVVESFDAATSSHLSITGNTLTIDPSADLGYGGNYLIEFGAGAVRDLAGNAYAGGSGSDFSTVPFGQTMVGGPSWDNLVGGALADELRGLDANDTLTGRGGNDVLNGGNGIDTAVFSGNRSQYLVVRTGENSFLVSGPDGRDTLTDVERLRFDDARLALDVNGNAGKAYRLYQAAFDRTPDTGGLGFQMNALDVGWDITDIAKNFLDSPEFQHTYGGLSNEQFVTLLYQNVLHRAPDAGGLAFHVANIEAGLPRWYVLVGFSESPENKAALIGVIDNGMAYEV